MNSYPLESVANIIRGITFSKSEGAAEPKGNSLPVIRAGSIQKNLLLDEGNIWIPANKIKPHQLIKKNDIIMCTSSGSSKLVGKCARSDKDWNGSFGAFCAGIRANESKCDSSFLYHFLCSPLFKNWSQKSSGANIKNIRASELATFKIPLPPLPEQKRIAAILDKADAIRRKRQQAIDLADQYLRSVFLDMFGDPVTNPKGWETPVLGKYINHANNGLSRRRKSQQNKGDIVLRLQDIHYDGIRFEKELNRINLDDKEKARYELHNGDLLFIRVNGNPDYVGRSAVFSNFNEEVFHNDHLIRLVLNDEYNPFFLSYLFNQRGGRKLISKKVKTSAGQHTINQEGIKSLQIIKPPMDLQNKFECIKKKQESIGFSTQMPNDFFNALSQQAFAGKL